ncbi:PAS domain-containing protein [Azohydromonas caseinilytica]|uniref:Virulence sensor protein BvgS n=1 Tax=Azohydromonas caseinilytica TaxID=2728836 RepID=A0A848FF34_9BURK|nr:PAS domain-containing protein [Azohydromonas caseinilytica]NML17994.1 PAS domain-containing protein [Azohydromonas caseinilytica]
MPASQPAAAGPSRAAALRLALLYAAGGALWILGSDWLLARLIEDPGWLVQAGALKGWGFVAVTATLLYLLSKRTLHATPAEAWAEPAPRPRRLALLAVSAAVVGLTAAALAYSINERRAQQLRQIEAVAAQHASQVGTWFSYRQSQARFVRSSSIYAAFHQRWVEGDPAALDQLLERLVVMRQAFGNHSVMVCDERGELIITEEKDRRPANRLPPPLRAGVLRAIATGEIQHVASGNDAAGTAWLDMVVPVQGNGTRAKLAVVLRMDLGDFVLPMLRTWPSASRGGTTLLVRREGDALIGVFGNHPIPVDTPGLLAGLALQGRIPFGRAVEGVDFRGVPVFGAVRIVPGTDWLLVSKMDVADLRAESLRGALWIAATGAMALLGAAIGAAMHRERGAREAAQARQRHQEERLHSMALVQAVTDSVLEHMAVLDRHGLIVKVNAAWVRFAADNGFSAAPGAPTAGLGMDYLALCRGVTGPGAEEARTAAAGIEAVLTSRQPAFSLQYACDTPHGRRWFHMTVTPLRTEGGGAVVVHSDVTERHQAKEQLRKLSLAVEQSPIAIAIADTEGRIEYVNDAFSRVTGFRREEALGQQHRVLRPDGLPPAREAAIRAALQLGQSWSGELQCLRRDGRPYHELVHAAPIRQPDGRITHHLWIGEDVTEKKRIAAELDRHRHRLQELVDERTRQLLRVNTELMLARDRADAASQAKSAFLANMSHEIRTPLNAILGLTYLLRRDVPDPAQAERLARVGAAAGHLMQLINDILDLSKIEAGRLELEETDFSLRALLAGARALVAEAAQAKGLVLEVDAGELPDALRGDPTRLSQALLNLMSNAVKFTARGRVEVRAQLLHREQQELTLCLRVRDTGIGIDPRELEQLFAAFVQSDASTTRRFGGTGLGLAITRRLASMMGGQAGASSEPAVGSEFWFSARVREGRPEAAVAPLEGCDADTLRQDCAGARVLLVEDDPASRELVLELLQSAGLRVETVADGLQAVEAARGARHHDLILMDVQMPVMDGLAATQRIRALPAHAATPILALTAKAFAQDRAGCLAAGMNDHVPKPVDPPRLYAALRRWLPKRGKGAPARLPAQAGPMAGPDNAHTVGAAQLEQLARLLRAGDFRAVARWRELAPALRRTHAGAAAEIEARLTGFDFEGALARLEALERAGNGTA